MKASYNWLKDYCEFDLPAHELAERLSHAGLNVDSYEPRGDDWVLDVEVKSNRPDCLCHLGLAREVAALVGSKGRRPDADPTEDEARPMGEVAAVEVAAPDLCPHYTARVITGVQVGPSPAWMQERLTACEIRPINNIVDVTNYVMLECGQPLHAFDLSLIGRRRIVVRRAQPGETLTTIDGAEHELTGEECVIADHFRPVALAGVMGGVESEIRDATTDLLLESARFEPRSVRRTARRHGLGSESSYRFERGVDPETTDWASRRACQLILELAGGTLLKGSADIRADSTAMPEVTLRLSRLALVLGLEVPRAEVLKAFGGLGLKVLPKDASAITVRVPSWRGDLGREIDLIEEVARIYGYDKIGETTQMPVRPVTPSFAEMTERRARHLLAAQGFHEVMTRSLVAPTPLQRAQPWCDDQPIAVRNPVTVERTHLRLTNMANLLLVKQLNQARGTARVSLFELGRAYLPRPEADTPDEKLCLSLLTDEDEGLRVLKGVLANLADELGAEGEIEESPGGRGPFEADESVELRLEGELLGCAGVVAKAVADELDLA
ncbi:MAG: phenylalanine--tRNA ligase subunit beta, partial [Candidatus Brocadiae bacterium]|nr:phenylalanine--tRNA ligase subunit beta [Candidatus Brocadiia bacterium]